MDIRKIKVVWICNVMNDIVREHLCSDMGWCRRALIGVFKLMSFAIPKNTRDRLDKYLYYRPQSDYGQWNTNAIREFESINSVELHVIIPINMTSCPLVEFEKNGIYYHIVKSHDSIIHKVFGSKVKLPKYKSDRKSIVRIIDALAPDLVHIIGAENPQYSQSVFDTYQRYPVIVQLQTLLSDPNVLKIDATRVQVAQMEKNILSLPVYIGTPMADFRRIILSDINPNAQFVDIGLAVNEPVERKEYKKEFDFVYFSANISKAADLAVEAFCLATRKHPGLTLDIIGAYSEDYKARLDKMLKESIVEQNVRFEGSLPTHEDVINRIRKARFALLPLKIDMIPGTIREACANGLPVVTTITKGTPELNKDRETALLSPIGDHAALAHNMIRLVEDSALASALKENGYRYAERLMNNRDMMKKWVEAYYSIIDKKNS